MTTATAIERSLRPASRALGRTGRLVLLLAALAQLFGVVAGPMDHWRASTRMGPHVERSGTSESHYQHDEATCTACAIGHITASPVRRVADVSLRFSSSVIARNVAHLPPFRPRRTQAAPRAPPASVHVG